jgi:hypothetical protein
MFPGFFVKKNFIAIGIDKYKQLIIAKLFTPESKRLRQWAEAYRKP